MTLRRFAYIPHDGIQGVAFPDIFWDDLTGASEDNGSVVCHRPGAEDVRGQQPLPAGNLQVI
jgi:hypothetical protein